MTTYDEAGRERVFLSFEPFGEAQSKLREKSYGRSGVDRMA